MSKPLPKHIQQLAPYIPGLPTEVVERQYGIKNAIKLASNENPLGVSPKALERMRAVVNRLALYPEGSCFDLRHALAKHNGVTPEEIICGNGSNEIIDLIADTFIGKDYSAVVSQGAFLMYRLAIQAAGGRLIETPMRDFTHDLDAMAAAIAPDTAVVYLANPNNPTGTWNRRDELERFLARVPGDVLIVLDEAYLEFVGAPDYPHGLNYYPNHPNLILLRTFSKIYGLAGIRLGYGIARPEIIAALGRVRPPFNVSTVAQAAGLGALEDTEFLKRSVAHNNKELPRVAAALKAMNIPVLPSAGNFLMIEVGDGPAFAEAMIKEAVIVRPLSNYGFNHHIRVSIGLEEENDKFLAAAKKVLGR